MLFRDKYSFLSNMAIIDPLMEYNGLVSNNLESLYQACKLVNLEDAKHIASLDGYAAKRENRKFKIKDNWDNIKISIMKDLLDIKFSNLYFKQLLLSTSDEELIEDNFWHDYFWGKCNGVGENNLGKLLMDMRNKFRLIADIKSSIYIGNLYKSTIINKYDYIGFTANNVINTKGELVMGKGNALVVKSLYPDLPKEIAPKIKNEYLLAFHNNVFAFQSKFHYRDDGDLMLIKKAANKLIQYAKEYPDKTFALPVPGIGNGNLKLDDVLSCFVDIPDNIHLWMMPSSYRYTGIGSRGSKELKDIPNAIKQYIMTISNRLSKLYICRTGDAIGTDIAFKNGCNGKTESYIPWPNFNSSNSDLHYQPLYAKKLASLNHPNWDNLSLPIIKLMSRNSLQVLGLECNLPSDFVICYTNDGCNSYKNRKNSTGGTGLAIALASKLGVPVYNISNENDIKRIELILESLDL